MCDSLYILQAVWSHCNMKYEVGIFSWG
jgi:hypothetical protein